jgi:hypothetical protein
VITARSSVVHMPPGHYDKIAQVIRHIVRRHEGYKKGSTSRYQRPPKRTRPAWSGCEYHPRIAVRLADEWKRMMEEQDPDGLLELWSR